MKHLVILLLTTISLSANAVFTPAKTVKKVIFSDRGVEITLNEYTNTSEEVKCNSNEFVLLNSDNSNYKVRVAFLLSAYIQQTTVRFSYYGCEGDKIRASSVHLD